MASQRIIAVWESFYLFYTTNHDITHDKQSITISNFQAEMGAMVPEAPVTKDGHGQFPIDFSA